MPHKDVLALIAETAEFFAIGNAYRAAVHFEQTRSGELVKHA